MEPKSRSRTAALMIRSLMMTGSNGSTIARTIISQVFNVLNGYGLDSRFRMESGHKRINVTGMSLEEENAEVLADIAARGTDLTVPRIIDFAHLLYSEAEASGFKRAAEEAGYKVQAEALPRSETGGADEAWDVTASSQMVPTVEQITRREQELAALVETFGGHSDGWGFESS